MRDADQQDIALELRVLRSEVSELRRQIASGNDVDLSNRASWLRPIRDNVIVIAWLLLVLTILALIAMSRVWPDWWHTPWWP